MSSTNDGFEQEEYELELDCSAVIADVWLVLDNECDHATRQRLQQHLDKCGSCLERYGIEEQIKQLLSRKCGGDRAPERLRQRLTLQIRQSTVIRRTEPNA
ncbi:mycothiol system anti-sigma-R factor [Skermania sp. ID1734]|uniref:mycothiol system anti-sigma-R factor n=1 Tax=Skermania sp. ID1734 TaxID=2597516 RepID=UPI00117FFB10|nr:mycothiol system anti-sigma-R factor [Skermania sp. ID1734]TSD97327.1 mycothiol system anti-sigma-R factor [Skermania sp. ID1734]